MLKAVIIDDESDAIGFLSTLIKEECEGITVIGTACSVLEGIREILEKKPDLLFLDVELSDGTGFDILNSIPDKSFRVVFTTAYNQYALKAIKHHAFDYLLKPIDVDEFIRVVNGMSKNIKPVHYHKNAGVSTLSNRLVLPTTNGYSIVDIQNILYCMADGSYVKFYYLDNTVNMVSRQLKEYEDLLLPHGFFRIHKSYLVNMSHIKEYVKTDGGYVVLNNGMQIPVATRKKEDFIKMLMEVNL